LVVFFGGIIDILGLIVGIGVGVAIDLILLLGLNILVVEENSGMTGGLFLLLLVLLTFIHVASTIQHIVELEGSLSAVESRRHQTQVVQVLVVKTLGLSLLLALMDLNLSSSEVLSVIVATVVIVVVIIEAKLLLIKECKINISVHFFVFRVARVLSFVLLLLCIFLIVSLCVCLSFES